MKKAALLLITVLLFGCVSEETPTTLAPTTTQTIATPTMTPATPKNLRGVSLSPASQTGDDFTNFFEKAVQAGNAVMWAGDWMELGDLEKGAPGVVTELASTYGYTPLVEAGFHSSRQLLRPLNDANKRAYKESAVAFAEKYGPAYLGLGIEVNGVYGESPEDFNEFVELYAEVYDAVKVASPNTRVFTVFQLERMKGLHGGLFGGENNESKAQWFLLDKFPKADFYAFTTYPCLIYEDPSDIPRDYYDEIKAHTSKPIAFTEIGWFRDGPEGWESDVEEQAEFINGFFELTEGLNPEIMVWSFLYDQDVQYPFDSMGLLQTGEESSPAFEAWSEGK